MRTRSLSGKLKRPGKRSTSFDSYVEASSHGEVDIERDQPGSGGTARSREKSPRAKTSRGQGKKDRLKRDRI